MWSLGSNFIYLYMFFLQKHFFIQNNIFFHPRTDNFQCSSNISTWLSEYSNQSSLFIQNSCSVDYHVWRHPYCTSVLSQLSSLTMIYFIIGIKSYSPASLVAMSTNCRPPSQQSILCILQFSPFLINFIFLAMCLVCLVYLPFLATHIED